MRPRLAAVVLGSSLIMLTGCTGGAEPAQSTSHGTSEATLTYEVPAASTAPPTFGTPSNTSEPEQRIPAATIQFIEGLPGLTDLGHRAQRPDLGLRATAWRDVAVIQMALNASAGFELDIDGHFGPDTDSAVRAFQASRGIEVDGYVGPETLRELVDALSAQGGAVPPPPTTYPAPTIPQYYGFTGGNVCSDGWISSSSGSGTCSSHGGIR